MSQWRNDPIFFKTLLHFIEVWQAHSSGLWLGHCNTLMLFFFGHSVVDLLLSLGKLSCCITQFEKSFSCQKDGLIFESRVLCYTDEFMVDCKVLRSFGCENESKSWPLWSTVSMRVFCQYVWFSPKLLVCITVKHLHSTRTLFKMSWKSHSCSAF